MTSTNILFLVIAGLGETVFLLTFTGSLLAVAYDLSRLGTVIPLVRIWSISE
jgi:hypothetical protein